MTWRLKTVIKKIVTARTSGYYYIFTEIGNNVCLFCQETVVSKNLTLRCYKVATLIAKHCLHFTEGIFIKDYLMKMVDIFFLLQIVHLPWLASKVDYQLLSNKVSKERGKAIKLHCISHQQVLCAKQLGSCYKASDNGY